MSFRAECERRGLKCVEQLLEEVAESQLLESASVLSQSQYKDVVDERNIDNLCGYPLCSKSLGAIPEQKYHISVARKQILDLTERKKFCNEVCYKCSEYFSGQLSTTPLWLRSDVTGVKVKLLSATEARKTYQTSVTRQDVKTTPRSTGKSSAQEHKPPLFSQLPKVAAIEEKYSIPASAAGISSVGVAAGGDLRVIGKRHQEPLVPAPNSTASHVLTGSSVAMGAAVDVNIPPTHTSLPPQLTVPPKVSQVSKLLGAISTWVSLPLDQLEEGDQDSIRTEDNTSESAPEPLGELNTSPDKVRRSCDHRNEKESRFHSDTKAGKPGTVLDGESKLTSHEADNAWSHDKGEAGTGSSHDKRKVKADAGLSHDKGKAKARSSHDKGTDTGLSHDKGKAKANTGLSHDKGEADTGLSHDEFEGETDRVIFLPPVDSVSVSRIQRSLFNSQLRQHLQNVCSTLDLSFHHILPLVSKNTSQFRLDRQCITFRVMEWRVLAALLIVISCGDVTDTIGNSKVKEWLEAIKATPQDFKLMLAAFRRT